MNLAFTLTITQHGDASSVIKGRGSHLAEICGNKRIFCLFTFHLYGQQASPVRRGEILTGKNGKVLISKASSANRAGKFIHVNALKKDLA